MGRGLLIWVVVLIAPPIVGFAGTAYDKVPIYDETADDLIDTVLAKYSVGSTYTSTRTGTLRMNGRELCRYVKVWEHTVLDIQNDIYRIRDVFRDNVNSECALRVVRAHVDDYTREGWLRVLTSAKSQFGARAITVYVDKDADVFGWSHNSNAIRYGDVSGWAEFLDRLLLMMRPTGQRQIAADVFEYSVDKVDYQVAR